MKRNRILEFNQKQIHASKWFLGSGILIFNAAPTVNAIELTDYVEVESTYQEAYLSGKSSTQAGNQERTSFDASVAAEYEKNFSSRERNMQILLDGFYSASRGPNNLDKTESTYEANASFNVDNYFESYPRTFWFGGSDINYIDASDNAFVDITAGVGYGRITDATPLARAMRVIEELREHQLISAAVTDVAFLSLAQVINKEAEFKSRYGAEEYKAKFIQALEDVLISNNVIEGNLSAAGVVHMQRVLFDERISIRKYGWLVRGGAGVIVNDFDGESGDPLLLLEAEYANPLSLATQLINRFSYSALLKGSDQNDQLINNRLSLTYELSDTIDWENSWSLSYAIADASTEQDILTNTIASTFRYYLTNQLSADATIALVKVEDDIDGNGNDETGIGSFLGVTYRLK